MGVRRTALDFEGQFTQIPNAWMRDGRLSRKARGVLAEIMTHRVGWHVSVNGLQKSGPEGRDAIKAALTELKDAGYLVVSQGRGDRGRWNEVEYELCDPTTADGFSVSGGSAASGSTASGQSAPKNTREKEHHQEELLSTDADERDPILDLIDLLWGLWPSSRRSSRKVVERAVRTAVKAIGGISLAAVITDPARAHAAAWATWPKADLRFVPMLSTWLNQERWTMPTPEDRAPETTAPAAPRMDDFDEGDEWMALR